jgi:hypothetical protein
MCGGSTVPFGAPYGHFADAASTIKEAQHPRVLAWGPAGDHTLCAMVNDLRVCERHAPLVNHEHRHQPGDMRYRYFLGVKWSQVQILSARPEFTQVISGFGDNPEPLFRSRFGLDSNEDSNG